MKKKENTERRGEVEKILLELSGMDQKGAARREEEKGGKGGIQ